MNLLNKYKEYRETQIKLHTKILNKCVSVDDFKKSIKTINVAKNKRIVLESDYEKDAILDFNVYENIKKGKNAVSEYIELNEEISSQEKELLGVMEKSKTGLYEVVESDENKGIVFLKDMLSESDNDVFKVIDVGLSKGLNKNIIIFTRLIHLEEYSMTSGLGF